MITNDCNCWSAVNAARHSQSTNFHVYKILEEALWAPDQFTFHQAATCSMMLKLALLDLMMTMLQQCIVYMCSAEISSLIQKLNILWILFFGHLNMYFLVLGNCEQLSDFCSQTLKMSSDQRINVIRFLFSTLKSLKTVKQSDSMAKSSFMSSLVKIKP